MTNQLRLANHVGSVIPQFLRNLHIVPISRNHHVLDLQATPEEDECAIGQRRSGERTIQEGLQIFTLNILHHSLGKQGKFCALLWKDTCHLVFRFDIRGRIAA